MKKKLLITMGCSYTEGNGCYGDFKTPSDFVLKPTSELFSAEELKLLPNQYHTNGWPLRLTKKIGYDRLINLGTAGSSTSGQLKRYFELYYDETFEDYDVTIIWLMTQPTRLSFYKNGKVADLLTHFSDESLSENVKLPELPAAYVKFIQDIDIDPILEQIFYIKCMEQYCENKNYNLLIAHTEFHSDILLKYYHTSKYYLSLKPTTVFSVLDDNDYAFCLHPNESGYEKISKFILSEIQLNHPKLLPHTPSKNVEWEWKGNSFQWPQPNETIRKKLKTKKI